MDEAVNGIFSFFFLSHTIVQCIPLALPCLAVAFYGVLIGFDQTSSYGCTSPCAAKTL